MAAYDIQNYLLDRANIHDTVTKMSLYLDMSRFDDLVSEVFAKDVRVDYTSMFGGKAQVQAVTDLVDWWKSTVVKLDSWQHVSTSILIELPQPGEGVEVPRNAGVVANCLVNLEKKAAKGDPRTSNGGRYILELSKTNVRGNPWRVSSLVTDFVWANGNWDVFN
ncbi:SnoaL-like domain-containing protein [Bisporella sp. PMI_857]|nr:SnoaL-like domain-containing protein [Bisporella sp. PMI_857]